jgi:hypothetical protein
LFLLFENFEVGVGAKARLDLAHEMHPSCPDLIRASINLRHTFFEDGSPGHLARRRAEPVIGPRFARTRWRFCPVTTISIGMKVIARSGAPGAPTTKNPGRLRRPGLLESECEVQINIRRR